MEKLPISVGILSWHSDKTLRNTLDSYVANGLFDIVDDVKIFFQETNSRDREIAEEYGIPRIESESNIGIGKAFLELAKYAKYTNFLTLEHDFMLFENIHTTYERLRSGTYLLGYRVSDAIRYRHRIAPGYPLFTANVYKGNELNHYDQEIDAVSPHLIDSLHWIEHPDKEFPDKITKEGNWYYTDSRWANFTNNPTMYKTDFYINKIGPFAGNDIALEGSIGKWWNRQRFNVAAGEGLFTHYDLQKYPK